MSSFFPHTAEILSGGSFPKKTSYSLLQAGSRPSDRKTKFLPEGKGTARLYRVKAFPLSAAKQRACQKEEYLSDNLPPYRGSETSPARTSEDRPQAPRRSR